MFFPSVPSEEPIVNLNPIRIAFKPKKDEERIKYVVRAEKVQEDIDDILGNRLIEPEARAVLLDNKEYIANIRDIVNDRNFTNKDELRRLYRMIRNLRKEVERHNVRLQELESRKKKNVQLSDLSDMVIQRIIKDSYRGIQNDSMKNTTNADLLEKYIVQTLQKEMRGQIKQDAAVAGESATEMQKKMDLLSTILEKLNSMERMYNRVHSDSKQQRKQIKAAVRDPVQEAMKLLDTNPNLYMD
jgi:hypothetical protein